MAERRRADSPLVGRGSELSLIDDVLAGITATSASGAAIVVRGEPGVGKTALLTAACARAAERGVRVLTCGGVLIESDLPYSGLHQLLRPILGRVDDLTPATRDALLSALGLSDDGVSAGQYQVGLAVLELLAVSDTPVLVAADDVHWLDRSTADVLAFVARRLADERIVLLATTRETSSADQLGRVDTIRELILGGLGAEAAAALLEASAPGRLASWRDRVLEVARGNPLALVELAAVAPEPGGFEPAELPLTDRLERAFGLRVRNLPASTRTMLLVAALHDREDLAEIATAAGMAGGTAVTSDDVGRAVAAGLLDTGDGWLRFRHPLMRSAVRQGATAALRHEAHAALAVVLADDPDRQISHRAAACVGPDEDVAADLEAAAARAVRRGAPAAASAALERAARVSPDPAERVRRLLAAADIGFVVGGPRSIRLLTELDALAVDPVSRARLHFWQQELLRQDWTAEEGIAASAESATRLHAAGHREQALAVLSAATVRCLWVDPAPAIRQRVIDAVRTSGALTDDLMRAALLTQVDPWTYAREYRSLLASAGDDPREPGDLLRLGVAASTIGDSPAVVALLERAVDGLRRQGQLGLLAQALATQAWAGLHLGRPELTITAAAESRRLAEETGQPRFAVMARISEAVWAGRRGDRALAESIALEQEAVLLRSQARGLLTMVEYARGTAALAVGDLTAAYEHFGKIYDPSAHARQPIVQSYAMPDMVETAVRLGRAHELRDVHAGMAALADRVGWPLLRTVVICTAPLVGADPGPAFAAALAHDLSQWPWHRARLLLAYGLWLRRERRVVEAREVLRSARTIFYDLGAVPWGAGADAELAASGERIRPRGATDRDTLTPQELQIASMAAAGMTNREIGERLFLSHRTVRTHLYRIFPKLGVSARGELGRALADNGSDRDD
ncbi:DNA-binding CsgD family transcriptional regulator [Actinoplanes lutulentus]|uniref:AAA family ATPase n=1 Tax=Actinoplanes lutulentus TaxID=1287878 RepID=UPI0011B935F3|nr:LuxR family transcriptional regulator [Actinoplanes lutulentus]MBB2940554.1 DNA-binding CsgD family transcriptional regulator [Actinoplanes lutulentus]